MQDYDDTEGVGEYYDDGHGNLAHTQNSGGAQGPGLGASGPAAQRTSASAAAASRKPVHASSAPSAASSAAERKKRAQVARACTRCAQGKRKCSGFPFPCERCTRLGLQDSCIEVETKRTVGAPGPAPSGGKAPSAEVEVPAPARAGKKRVAPTGGGAHGGAYTASGSQAHQYDEYEADHIFSGAQEPYGFDEDGSEGPSGSMAGGHGSGAGGSRRHTKVRRMLSNDDAAQQSHGTSAVNHFAALSLEARDRHGNHHQSSGNRVLRAPLASPDSSAAAAAVASFQRTAPASFPRSTTPPSSSAAADVAGKKAAGEAGEGGGDGSSTGLELLLRASGESSPAGAQALVRTLTESIGTGGVAPGKTVIPGAGFGRSGQHQPRHGPGIGGKTGGRGRGAGRYMDDEAHPQQHNYGGFDQSDGVLFYDHGDGEDGAYDDDDGGAGYGDEEGPDATLAPGRYYQDEEEASGAGLLIDDDGDVDVGYGGHRHHHRRHHHHHGLARGTGLGAHDDGSSGLMLDEDADGLDDGPGLFFEPASNAGSRVGSAAALGPRNLIRSPQMGPVPLPASAGHGPGGVAPGNPSSRSPALRANNGPNSSPQLQGRRQQQQHRGGFASPSLLPAAVSSAGAGSAPGSASLGARKLTPLEAEARTLSDAYRDHLALLASSTVTGAGVSQHAVQGDDHSGKDSQQVGANGASKWPSQGHVEARVADLGAAEPYPAWRLTFADRYTGNSAADHAAATAPSQAILEAWLPGTSLRVGDRGSRVLFTGSPFRYEANASGLAMFNISPEDLLLLPFREEVRRIWAHPQDAPYRSAFCSKMQQEGNNSYQWRGRYLRRTCSRVRTPSGGTVFEEKWAVFLATELVFVDFWPSGYVRYALSTFSDIAVTDTALTPSQLAEAIKQAETDAMREKQRAEEEMKEKQAALQARLNAAAAAAQQQQQSKRSPALSGMISPVSSSPFRSSAAASAALALQLPPPRLPRGSTGSDNETGPGGNSLGLGLTLSGLEGGASPLSAGPKPILGGVLGGGGLKGSAGSKMQASSVSSSLLPARTDPMLLLQHRGSSGDFGIMNADFGAAAGAAMAVLSASTASSGPMSAPGAGSAPASAIGNQSTGGLSQNSSYGNLQSLTLGPPDTLGHSSSSSKGGLITSSNASSASGGSISGGMPYLAPLGGAFAGLAMNMGRSISEHQMQNLLGAGQHPVQLPGVGNGAGSMLVSRPNSADMIPLVLRPTSGGVGGLGVGAGDSSSGTSMDLGGAGRGSFSTLAFDAKGVMGAPAAMLSAGEGGSASSNNRNPSFDSRLSGDGVFGLQALDAIISAPGFGSGVIVSSNTATPVGGTAAPIQLGTPHVNPLLNISAFGPPPRIGSTGSAGPEPPSSLHKFPNLDMGSAGSVVGDSGSHDLPSFPSSDGSAGAHVRQASAFAGASASQR